MMHEGPAGTYEASADGVLLEVDSVFVELSGVTEPVGRGLVEVMYPGSSDAASWIDSSAPSFVGRTTSEGVQRWIETLRVRAPGGGWVGFIRDMTSLYEANERYNTLIDTSPIGVVIIQDGTVIYSNDAQERIWPTQDRNAAKLLAETMHPDDLEVVTERIRRREAGEEVPGNYRYRVMQDNEVRWQEVWSSRVNYHGRPAVQAVSMDVTESVALEAQLRSAQKLEAIGRLAGGVAHDFNNLLMVIMGAARFIAMDLEPHPEAAAVVGEDLEQLTQAADRAKQLTAQLLAFSQKRPAKLVQLDLNAALEGMAGILHRMSDERVGLEMTLDSAATPIQIDPGQLEQIITNLVVNARDAMPEGGQIIIATSLESALDDDGARCEYVAFHVTDSGTGISKENLSLVFDPFFTTKEVGKGTGLGLSTVFGIVEAASGKVRIDSTIGEGTTVHVLLPLSLIPQADSVVDTGPTASTTRAPPIAARVLVVDDKPDVQRVVARILQQASFTIDVAPNGSAALDMLRSGLCVDLVVADVLMPGMSGIELEQILSAERPELPVALMTGYTETRLIPENRTRRLLRKPFMSEELVALATELVNNPKG
jgi:two-component system cell cycle sensor histidine kinase/response regulator CckA